MKLGRDLLEGIREFLDLMPPKTLRRGRNYFGSGAVRELTCLEADHLYSAVVRGGEDYEVGLEFGGGEWAAECSCPMVVECKHIVAALLALQQCAADNGNGAIHGLSAAQRQQIAEAARSRWQTLPGTSAAAKGSQPGVSKQRSVPQPPRSPLYDKLVEKLGRELQRDEAEFIRRIQTSFANARGRALNENDLGLMAGRGSALNYWKPLDLWPDFPPDDFHFWLFVGRELRRRGWKFPQFMDGITDLSVIEPAIKQWRRQKEIAQWKNWFTEFDARPAAAEPGVLELRLAVLPDEARLQWRSDAKSEFTEFNQAHAQKFAHQFDQGALMLTSDSLPLWSAAYKPWHYENWWLFKYGNAAARPALNRLLRLPLAPDRVVTPDGRPLPRLAEPLRLDLRSPQNGDGDYELTLATASGSPPPKIFCTLRGRPALYLTEHGLFTGPSADLLDTGGRKQIPAPALETADGLRFLHAAGVSMPDHMARRVKTVPVVATISCGLKLPYPGSQTENLIVSVTAGAPGMTTERFTPQGWQAWCENDPKQISEACRPDACATIPFMTARRKDIFRASSKHCRV